MSQGTHCAGCHIYAAAKELHAGSTASAGALRSQKCVPLASAVWPPLADINECTDGTADCVFPATCVDKNPTIDGAKFVCTCPSGYTPSGNNTTCDGAAKPRQQMLESMHTPESCARRHAFTIKQVA